MKQDFETKVNKYLGGKHHVGKMSRMDKVKRKQEIDFEPEINPIVRIFDRVERKLTNLRLYDAVEALIPFL